MRTPESAIRELRVYVAKTLQRRRAARERERRTAQAAELDQVQRDLERIVGQVPECLLEADPFDPQVRRREINALYAAALDLELDRPALARELRTLHARLRFELRGGASMAAASVSPSS